MITVTKSNIHWNYYSAIERDLEKLSRYIEFDKSNFETFSIELAHLLLAASSEIDVLMKELCKLVAPEKIKDKMNISMYREIIKEYLPDLISEPININRFGIKVVPWENWNYDKNPNWWTSYNNVKHKRNKYFSEAHLRNTINSVGALLITNYYYHKKLFEREAALTLEPKEVMSKLSYRYPFIELRNEYYYDNLVC